MPKPILFFLLLLLAGVLGLLASSARAQNPKSDPNVVNIRRADQLEGSELDKQKKLIGNVLLEQGNVLIYCNLAIQDVAQNTLQAYGNVRIIQGDSVTLTGDTALYFGNTRQARMRGRRVVLNDKTINLTTRRLDYNMTTHVAVYSGGGTILDRKSTLTSREGTYNTVTKLFTYRKNVRIVDPETVITADSLRYSALSKEAFFIDRTKVVNKGDTLYAKPGSTYNTATRVSNFKGRSQIRTKQYDLTADTLIYDPPTKIGIAHGNVIFVSRADSSILTGREGRYYGQRGTTRVWGDALLRNLRQRDTLYLSADTLVSRETYTPTDTIRRLLAYPNVLIFKRDFQGKCDSLIYAVSDSLLFFYKKPILWSTGSQSEGDSVQLRLKNGVLDQMILRGHAFVISQDTVKNFNQVKGRLVTAYLRPDSKLDRVQVDGNGESIYFALDERAKLIGMNRVLCGRMTLNFREGEVKRIAFVGKPDGSLTPPGKITAESKELDGFYWRGDQRPSREQVINHRQPPVPPRRAPSARPTAKKPTGGLPATKPLSVSSRRSSGSNRGAGRE